jgi:hypothetical protein
MGEMQHQVVVRGLEGWGMRREDRWTNYKPPLPPRLRSKIASDEMADDDRKKELQETLVRLEGEWEGLQALAHRIFDINDSDPIEKQIAEAKRKLTDLPTAKEIAAFSQVQVEHSGVKPIAEKRKGLGSRAKQPELKGTLFPMVVVRASPMSSKFLRKYKAVGDGAGMEGTEALSRSTARLKMGRQSLSRWWG